MRAGARTETPGPSLPGLAADGTAYGGVRDTWLLTGGLVAFGGVLFWFVHLAAAKPGWGLSPVDMGVYRDAGLVVRHVRPLYHPHLASPLYDRFLVPVVLPGFILLAVWASGWLLGRLRQMAIERVLYAGACCCLAALLLVPAAITTFGLRISGGGVAAEGLAFKTTYQGEIGAVDHMCAAIPRGSSVVLLSGAAGNWLPGLVRGMCGDPAAVVVPRYPDVEAAVRGIVRTGRRPVLIGTTRSQLTRYGGQIGQIMRLRTNQDGDALTGPPLRVRPFSLDVWMSEPSR